jgi:hypothetical protein
MLPEEEDSRVADRAGPPVSEGKVVGQARPEGGGIEVGCGWARRGRNRGAPWLGQKGDEERSAAVRILFGIWIFGKLWKCAQGDSEGILTWGFFLKSSRLLKDF